MSKKAKKPLKTKTEGNTKPAPWSAHPNADETMQTLCRLTALAPNQIIEALLLQTYREVRAYKSAVAAGIRRIRKQNGLT